MIIREKLGTLNEFPIGGRQVELLPLEWYERRKRILHKRTALGKEIIIKCLKENPELSQDDVLYQDETLLIVVDIQPCEAIVVCPEHTYQVACLCYEIGNKHLPLFYQGDELLVPFETPLFRLLQASGYEPKKELRKLLHPLKTTVAPHNHNNSRSLFSKIVQLTSPNEP